MALLSALGETIWGSASEFELVRLNLCDIAFPAPEYSAVQESESGDLSVLIQHMEIRYQYENELMHLVSKGLVHRAENMLNQFSEYNIEQRAQDPLRNYKNYAVICNTLFFIKKKRFSIYRNAFSLLLFLLFFFLNSF